MRPEPTISFLLLFASCASLFAQQSDPFTNEGNGIRESGRLIEKLPDSIQFEILNNGKCRYTIDRIYDASYRTKMSYEESLENETESEPDSDDPFGKPDYEYYLSDNYPAHEYESMVPDCEEFHFDFPNRKCFFITSHELDPSKLADTIDQMAWAYGDLPYWHELEARDIPRSEHFDEGCYTIEDYEKEWPPNTAMFRAIRDRPIATQFVVHPAIQGEVLITPSTAHCMLHSRFALRILDMNGELLWLNDETLCADVVFAVSDIDNDGFHEILIDQNDHGETSRLVIRRNQTPKKADQ